MNKEISYRKQCSDWWIVAAVAAIGLVAAILLWNHVLYGYPDGHSGKYNIPWFQHFLGQLRMGDFYPRWLFDYPDDMGSPVFYFYGPGPFYLAAAVGLVACPSCNTVHMLSIAHWAITFLSGVSFYAWMAGLAGPRTRLVATVVYMLLPYHYIDSEVRNSLGEAMAYVWLPLILLSTRRLVDSDRGVPLAAFTYAGLIISHLPSALLATPFVILFSYASSTDAYTLGRTTRRLAAVGALGAGLSAFYLLPALMLRAALQPDAWVGASGTHFFPEKWLLLAGNEIPDFGLTVYASLAFASTLGVVGALGAALNRTGGLRFEFSFPQMRTVGAGLLSLGLCWLLMSSPSRSLWVHVDPMRQVQFPWRLGIVVDFWGATLLGVGLSRQLGQRATGSLKAAIEVAAMIALVAASTVAGMALVIHREREHFQAKISDRAWRYADPSRFDYPLEYRPRWVVASTVYRAGLERARAAGIEEPYRQHFEAHKYWRTFVDNRPLVGIRGDQPTSSTATSRVDGNRIVIVCDLEEPATIIVRRRYFPHWWLGPSGSRTASIPLRPTVEEGLVSFDLPAGNHNLVLEKRRTLGERWGEATSLLALCAAAWVRLRQNRHPI